MDKEGDSDAGPTEAPSTTAVDRLLVCTVEEEEMEAKGMNSSNEGFDEDFLIMEEVNDGDDDDDREGAKKESEEDNSSRGEDSGSRKGAADKPEKESINTEASSPRTVDPESVKDDLVGVKDDLVGIKGDLVSAKDDPDDTKGDIGNTKEETLVMECGDSETELVEPQVPELVTEVAVEAEVEELGTDEEEVDGEQVVVGDEEDEETEEQEEEVDEEEIGMTDVGAEEVATEESSSKGDDNANPSDESGVGKENESPLVNGGGTSLLSCKEDPDVVDLEEEPETKKRRRLTPGFANLAELKRALGILGDADSPPDTPKRIKMDADSSAPEASAKAEAGVDTLPVGIPVGPNLVVLSRVQLEQYVTKRLREVLSKREQELLQPMEKKCDTLHRALERWRRRSFQLQKQLNEFVCEQEKCAGARRGRVMQRSVGVCVRMPPLKQPPPPMPVMVPTRATTAPAPVVRTQPQVMTNAGNRVSPQQIRVSTSTATSLAAQLGLKPNQHMKLVTVASPGGPGSTLVTRMPPQLQAAPGSIPTSIPVPMQLIANTATPASQVKSVNLPAGTVSSGGTVMRTVAVVSSAPSGTPTTTTTAYKFIDLTQEEEGGQSKIITVPVPGTNTVQKISVPSSSIPMLSAAPTSLVQVNPSSGQTTSRVSVAGSTMVFTHATTMSSAGTVAGSPMGQPIRLNQPMVGQPRVTYLVPSLPPGMVVTPRESGPPRLTAAGAPGTAMPMQTILLRMAAPPGGFPAGVPGSTITMGNLAPMAGSAGGAGHPPGTTMMVAAPPGSQVRMIRAPPPMSLPRGATTYTLPPGTTVVRGPPMPTGGVTMVQRTPPPPLRVQVQVPQRQATPTVVQPLVPPAAPVQEVATPSPTPATTASSSAAPVVRPPPSKEVSVLSVVKHPAPLPPMPRYLDDPKKKRVPPKPALKITKAASGLVLSWNMTFNSLYAGIQTYQLYAYQETGAPPATSHWKKVGDVRALPLPMACTLTQFVEGHKYHFAVRAVDVHNRLGPFSDPSSILLQ